MPRHGTAYERLLLDRTNQYTATASYYSGSLSHIANKRYTEHPFATVDGLIPAVNYSIL